MGRCQTISASFVNLLNAVLLILSLVVLGFSAFLAAELGDFDDVLASGAIVVPAVFAGFMMVIAIIGLVAVTKRIKCLVLVYIVAASVVTLAVFSSGAALLVFSGVLDTVQNDNIQFAQNTVEVFVRDFQLALFNECCDDDAGVTLAENCDDSNQGADCIVDPDSVAFVADFPDQVCDALENVIINGDPIVGPAAQGGCGGGSALAFVDDISTFFQDNIKPLGITNLVVAIIMFLDLIASCVVLWTKRADFDKKPQAQAQQDYKDVKAPEVAQGQEMKY